MVTKYYCDKCGVELKVEASHFPSHVSWQNSQGWLKEQWNLSMTHVQGGVTFSNVETYVNKSLCQDCFNKIKDKIEKWINEK